MSVNILLSFVLFRPEGVIKLMGMDGVVAKLTGPLRWKSHTVNQLHRVESKFDVGLDVAIGVTLRVNTDSAVIGLILKNPRFVWIPLLAFAISLKVCRKDRQWYVRNGD